MMTASSGPKWDCWERAGASEGRTYSPLFRLTLKARTLMSRFKHGLSHPDLPCRIWESEPFQYTSPKPSPEF
jgi:hypothetical protein